MFENLAKIDWQQLCHAYGEASDVPGMLRDLASDQEETREAALYSLYGTIWHQGTVYEATSYAVPFLLELLEDEQVQDKDDLLVFLFYLAHGHSYKAVHQALEANFYGEAAVKTPQYQAEMQVELFWVRQAHDAVAAGMTVYFALLEHADPAIRMCVLYTLTSFGEYAETILPVVNARLAQECDPGVRASLLFCLGALALERPAEYRQLFEELVSLEDEHALVRLAAAIVLLRLNRGATPPREAVQRLIRAVTAPEDLEEAYASLPWNDAGVVADTCLVFCGLEPEAAMEAFVPCLEALKKTTAYGALSLTKALLSFVFGRGSLPSGSLAQDLTPAQRTLLTTLATSERVWTINGNMAEILELFAVPTTREQLQHFLAS